MKFEEKINNLRFREKCTMFSSVGFVIAGGLALAGENDIPMGITLIYGGIQLSAISCEYHKMANQMTDNIYNHEVKQLIKRKKGIK